MFEAKKFSIPELTGISKKSVDEHIGLYEGYVKNFNAISKLLGEYAQDSEKHAHALSELIRRRSFEFGGMRLHELYFAQLEGGTNALDENSALGKALLGEYAKMEYFNAMLRGVAMMRGPGWAIVYFDPESKHFFMGFSGEQHQGHFATLPIVLALDVWEHAYLLDHGAQGKGKYVDAFMQNLNWKVLEERFAKLQ